MHKRWPRVIRSADSHVENNKIIYTRSRLSNRNLFPWNSESFSDDKNWFWIFIVRLAEWLIIVCEPLSMDIERKLPNKCCSTRISIVMFQDRLCDKAEWAGVSLSADDGFLLRIIQYNTRQKRNSMKNVRNAPKHKRLCKFPVTNEWKWTHFYVDVLCTIDYAVAVSWYVDLSVWPYLFGCSLCAFFLRFYFCYSLARRINEKSFAFFVLIAIWLTVDFIIWSSNRLNECVTCTTRSMPVTIPTTHTQGRWKQANERANRKMNVAGARVDTNSQIIKNTTQLRETQSIEWNQIIGDSRIPHKKGVLNRLHWKYTTCRCLRVFREEENIEKWKSRH